MKKIKGKNVIKFKGKKKKPLMKKIVKIKKTPKKAVKKTKIKRSVKKSIASVKKIKKSVASRSNKPVKKSKPATRSKPAIIKKAKVTELKVKPKLIKKIKKTISSRFAESRKKLKAVDASSPMEIKAYMPAKNELYMCSKQIDHFKIILNIWKEQLMAEMNRTVQHMKTYAANFPDPVDRASQEEDFNLELKTRERERKLIKKIDEALEKIQGGDYGFCVECGAEIGIKRLEARPTASQCIECKTIAEIREKQTGG